MKLTIDTERVNLRAHAPLLLAGAAAGFGTGFGTAYLVCRRAFRARLDREVTASTAHLRHELDSLTTSYNEQLKEALTPYLGAPFVGRSGSDSVVAHPGHRRHDEVDGIPTMGPEVPDPLEGLEGDGPGDSSFDSDDREDDEADPAGDTGPDDVDPGDVSPEEGGVAPVRTEALVSAVERSINRPYKIPREEFEDTPPGFQRLTLTYYAGDNVLTDEKDVPIENISKVSGPLGPLIFGGISGDPHICYIRNQALEADLEIILDRRKWTDAALNYGDPNRGEE